MDYRAHFSSPQPRVICRCALAACLAIVVAIAPVTSRGQERDVSAPPVASARELFLSGRFDEAVEEYQKKQQRTAQDDADLAQCHLSTGNTDRARAVLKEAIRRQPEEALLAGELARLELECGNYDAALRLAESALELDDKCLPARWVQAELHRLNGRMEAAQVAFEWFIRHYNSGAPIARSEDLHLVGLATAEYARWTRNHTQFKRLISDLYPGLLEREPKYWPAHLEMARLFAEKYNQADAAESIAAGLAINPQAVDLHVLRVQLAVDQFDLAAARSSLERALAINPNHLGAQRIRADILLADVRPAEAVDVLEGARKLQPQDEETLGRLAAAYAAVDGMPDGRPAARMQELIDQVAKANPHCGVFYLSAGDALDRMRRFPQAAEHYRLAQQKMPQLVQTRGKLGMTLMRLGEEAEAAVLLDEAFTIDPFNFRVKNTLEVLETLKGYAVLETEHFVLKFDRGSDELLARYAARYLEREVYPQLVEQFGFRPEGKTLIEIFSRHKSTSGHGWFSARMVGLPAIGTVGACAGRMIALTSPDEIPKKLNWARVLRHEYVHVLNLQQTDFCIPHWFTEGLAVHSEGGPRARSWNEILARRLHEKKLFDLDALTFGFVRPASSEEWSLAYCQAALHVDYMHDKFGPQSSAAMLAAYAQRKSTAEAIEQALGVKQAEFEQGYREYVGEYLAKQGVVTQKKVPSLADLEQAATNDGADAAAKAALARAHLDRKNLPEARRWAIAAREQAEGDPLAAYVLARLQLSIGDSQAALELLEKTVDAERPQEDHLALLAAMKLQGGDLAEAERLHQLGQKHFAASDRWLKGLARIYLAQQDGARLAPVLEKLADLEPESQSIRKKLAELALARRDFASARNWARQLIHLDVKDDDAHGQLAAAAQGLADLALAAEEYETCVSLKPERNDWRFAWAGVLAELGKKDEARRVAEEVKQQDDDYPGIDALLEKLKRE